MRQLPSTRSRFVRTLSRSLTQQCHVRAGDRLTVAVSGGADSLAVLAGLAALARRPHLAYPLHVAHVNHHLRPEADEEASSVVEIAAQLDVPCHVVDLKPADVTRNVSAWARRERYRALADLAMKHDSHAVVTAHHGADQLETLLLNLVRGAGPSGLAAMRWKTRVYGCPVIRPLLNQTHADCMTLCRTIGWHWSEDPSNRNTNQRRNRIRADVMPALMSIGPDLDRRIHRTTDQLAELSRFLRESAQALAAEASVEPLGGVGQVMAFDRTSLTASNRVVAAEVIRQSAIHLGAPARSLSAEALNSVARAMADSQRHPRMLELPGGVTVRITSRIVSLTSDLPRKADSPIIPTPGC